jgi:sirohydrochlorin cobaltochelatase
MFIIAYFYPWNLFIKLKLKKDLFSMKRRKLVSLLLTTLLIISSGASLMAKAEKKAVVIAAFGTSYPKALSSIINVAEAVRKELPGTEVRIALTSNIIRKIWHKSVNDKEYRSENPSVPSYVFLV